MDRKLWKEPLDERALLEGAALGRGELLTIREGRGALLFVDSGEVWLTQERDPRDVVLPAGAWFRLDRSGTAVVQARRAASVTLTAAADGQVGEIRTWPNGEMRRRARRPERPLARAFLAWWLRLYRHPRPSAARRFTSYL
jgi:hypothetical protein